MKIYLKSSRFPTRARTRKFWWWVLYSIASFLLIFYCKLNKCEIFKDFWLNWDYFQRILWLFVVVESLDGIKLTFIAYFARLLSQFYLFFLCTVHFMRKLSIFLTSIYEKCKQRRLVEGWRRMSWRELFFSCRGEMKRIYDFPRIT